VHRRRDVEQAVPGKFAGAQLAKSLVIAGGDVAIRRPTMDGTSGAEALDIGLTEQLAILGVDSSLGNQKIPDAITALLACKA